MPSLWLLLILNLAPIMPLTSVGPALCTSDDAKSDTFVFRDRYGDSPGFQEVHFNLKFSCVWSAVDPESAKNPPPCLNAVKILPKRISGDKENIYMKAEEFISEITHLIPTVKLNFTGNFTQDLWNGKKHRKNRPRLEKRLQIGIYRSHSINPEEKFNSWQRNVPRVESNVTDTIEISTSSRNNTRGIHEDRITRENCTHKYAGSINCADDVIDRFRSTWPVHLWLAQNFSSFNTHWLKFPPPSPAAYYTLAVLYAIIMVFGICGNAFAIYMFLRCRSLRTPANVLVMNLAVSDLLLLSKMPIFIYNSIYHGPALGNFACQLYGFLGGLTGTVSIMTLASIAADRYNVVAEPFKRTTYARARVTVALTWVYGATFAGLPLVVPSLGRYKPEGYLTSCSFDYLTPEPRVKAFILCFFVAAWLLPFCLISFCYIGILRVVMAARHLNVGDQVVETSNKHCREEEKRRTELRLAFVVIGIIGMWFVSWSPYAVVALLGVFGQNHLVTPLASMVPALFCKTASCLDPYVYAVAHPRFRSELHHLTKRSRRKRSARQWSPQHRSQTTCPRLTRHPDGLDNGVEEEMQCLGSIEIISMASRRSVSRDTATNFSSSVRTTSCSFNQPKAALALYTDSPEIG
ncbi:melanopsin-like isoform X1 [Neodiprion fabricii]|uniref:melanopsin-like isoform X1 n=1 Tax=Neodiprion fabricii TaxID=2872261 RepID=UPI001ED9647A|nr:melanopsin-like isoform X1 [Neodiprion fabricii]XP_046429464.1 melanopsin-like isoform X1 [Neodiprion fabricii]XP_046429473.1 melanopsin-like isoform X1 [Neodiprion fabricii]XP_046429484.1 melanopsin-like isoform X1 [Neodiprion fabricii]XP_046429493.1 melanopsin-like isoform X1 [Neodiprion fabricii]XP_046429503.1 melanopsin-like isoform X1 [Neodiprion fabricii]XP_046429513.1 melanopsin-like isoform X1 [Neodiprion fabricii]XP_046429514.1 melanopsin-like isoform X1 [Neodiprion fabricii]XP_